MRVNKEAPSPATGGRRRIHRRGTSRNEGARRGTKGGRVPWRGRKRRMAKWGVAKIAETSESDRALAERTHAIVEANESRILRIGPGR